MLAEPKNWLRKVEKREDKVIAIFDLPVGYSFPHITIIYDNNNDSFHFVFPQPVREVDELLLELLRLLKQFVWRELVHLFITRVLPLLFYPFLLILFLNIFNKV